MMPDDRDYVTVNFPAQFEAERSAFLHSMKPYRAHVQVWGTSMWDTGYELRGPAIHGLIQIVQENSHEPTDEERAELRGKAAGLRQALNAIEAPTMGLVFGHLKVSSAKDAIGVLKQIKDIINAELQAIIEEGGDA